MNLFIDTNVYLHFYDYGDDDLEEMRKLLTALNEKAVQLFITPQIVREFDVNRENVIAITVKDIEKRFNKRFPRITHHYEEYANLRKCLEAADKYISVIGDKVRQQAKQKQLKADEVISLLFEHAIKIDEDSSILSRARERHLLRLPPGKNDSLGDSINWESLISHISNKSDLHIVTGDGDYASKIDPSLIKAYLIDEWRNKKQSEVLCYSSLSDFFRKHFPDIQLSVGIERKIRIDKFVHSKSFSSTHSAIEGLKSYLGSFSDDEANELISAAISNPQISRIYNDSDVRDFIDQIVSNHDGMIDPDSMGELALWYGVPSEPEVGLPF